MKLRDKKDRKCLREEELGEEKNEEPEQMVVSEDSDIEKDYETYKSFFKKTRQPNSTSKTSKVEKQIASKNNGVENVSKSEYFDQNYEDADPPLKAKKKSDANSTKNKVALANNVENMLTKNETKKKTSKPKTSKKVFR